LIFWKSGGIAIDHMHARIVGKLPFQITGKCAVQFKEKQLRIPIHARGQFARMNALARTIFGDCARPAEIHFARDPLDQGLGAGDD